MSRQIPEIIGNYEKYEKKIVFGLISVCICILNSDIILDRKWGQKYTNKCTIIVPQTILVQTENFVEMKIIYFI